MRASSSKSLFVLLLALPLLGCLTEVDSKAGREGATCKSDQNCREDYVCVLETGTCQRPGYGDAGSLTDAGGAETDGWQGSPDGRYAGSDGGSDLGSQIDGAQDTATPDSSGAEADAPAAQPDVPAAQPDALTGWADTLPADTPPCNSGCCDNDQCGPDKPVCNGADQCVGCKTDEDCAGRAMTACNVTTGACVQCTQSKPCTSPLTCDLSKNRCVGCTTRGDCTGACLSCSDGSCVPVKNADDPTQCTGTCDSTGVCKAKRGQPCKAPSDCLDNMACADGVCCNRACTGTCEACDVASALGTCTVLPAGNQPHHGTCAGTGTGVAHPACAGSCQGDATCSYPPATTVCGTATCTPQNQAQGAGTCNGTGLCGLPTAVTCKTGSACEGGKCKCQATLPNECPNACVNFKTDAKNCGACGRDCLGGTCLEGLCQPVAVASPAQSQKMTVFGLDTQYLYYEDSPASPLQHNHERMSLSAGTVTSLRTGTQARGVGVIGTTVYFGGDGYMGVPSYCTAASCASSTHNLTGGYLIAFGHPSPPFYALAQTADFLEITWYSTANIVMATWRDDVVRSSDFGFTGLGNTVYWIGETSTTRELLSVDSTTPSSITRKRMAGQIPANCYVLNVNPQSLFLSCNSSLYRVPLPDGMNGNPPTLVLAPASDVEFAIEDETSLYWANSLGTIYKCPANDLAKCVANQVLLTTSAPTTGFFQDAKYLYWGTVAEGELAKAQILRMAK